MPDANATRSSSTDGADADSLFATVLGLFRDCGSEADEATARSWHQVLLQQAPEVQQAANLIAERFDRPLRSTVAALRRDDRPFSERAAADQDALAGSAWSVLASWQALNPWVSGTQLFARIWFMYVCFSAGISIDLIDHPRHWRRALGDMYELALLDPESGPRIAGSEPVNMGLLFSRSILAVAAAPITAGASETNNEDQPGQPNDASRQNSE